MITELTVEGLADLINSFEKVERGTLDLRQLGTWDWVQSEFYKATREKFENAGPGWAPLSSSYETAKTRKFRGPTRILISSGAGMRSLTADGGDAVVDKQPQEMTLGSSLKYMGYHHTGTRKMPKRDPIEFSDAQTEQIVAPIGKKLKQLIDNAKLRDIRGF